MFRICYFYFESLKKTHKQQLCHLQKLGADVEVETTSGTLWDMTACQDRDREVPTDDICYLVLTSYYLVGTSYHLIPVIMDHRSWCWILVVVDPDRGPLLQLLDVQNVCSHILPSLLTTTPQFICQCCSLHLHQTFYYAYILWTLTHVFIMSQTVSTNQCCKYCCFVDVLS